jgi:hypothetical protein
LRMMKPCLLLWLPSRWHVSLMLSNRGLANHTSSQFAATPVSHELFRRPPQGMLFLILNVRE